MGSQYFRRGSVEFSNVALGPFSGLSALSFARVAGLYGVSSSGVPALLPVGSVMLNVKPAECPSVYPQSPEMSGAEVFA